MAFPTCLLVLGLAAAGLAQDPCNTEGEKREMTCASYIECIGGVWEEVFCSPWPDNTVDFRTGECVLRINAEAPCNQLEDCSNLDTGNYPYMGPTDDNCYWFYTCDNESFKGHQPCNPNNFCTDQCLVFEPEPQICNFHYAVSEPCGSCDPLDCAPPTQPPRN